MIVFDNVELKYHYEDYSLLKGADFVLDGQINTVLCDTQSGKSSICRLLCKDIRPTNGKISIDEKSLDSITLQDLGILYLPRKSTFFENKSILKNIEYPLRVRKTSKSERLERVMDVLNGFDISNVGRKVKNLDDKLRKTIALARGLTVARKIVLFDDFFDEYDDIDAILNMFDGATVIILTSDVKYARGKTVVLDGGITVYQGDADGATRCVNGLSWLVNM